MAKAKLTKLPVAKAGMSYPADVTSNKSTKEQKDRERRYRAEDALRTVEEYGKISSDKGLMKDVKALAKEKIDKLKKVC